MPMCVFFRKMIIILLESLQYLNSWSCNVHLYGGVARFRILVLAVFCLIANQKRSFWGTNQSGCEKDKYNAYSFFVSRSWSCSEKNLFFHVDIVVKKQIEYNLALSVLLSTTICVITEIKMLWTWEAQQSESTTNSFDLLSIQIIPRAIPEVTWRPVLLLNQPNKVAMTISTLSSPTPESQKPERKWAAIKPLFNRIANVLVIHLLTGDFSMSVVRI